MLPDERKKLGGTIQLKSEDCTLCKLCYELGCPAIEWDDETGPIIDELQCVGCELCAMLCKPDALYMPEVTH